MFGTAVMPHNLASGKVKTMPKSQMHQMPNCKISLILILQRDCKSGSIIGSSAIHSEMFGIVASCFSCILQAFKNWRCPWLPPLFPSGPSSFIQFPCFHMFSHCRQKILWLCLLYLDLQVPMQSKAGAFFRASLPISRAHLPGAFFIIFLSFLRVREDAIRLRAISCIGSSSQQMPVGARVFLISGVI